MTHSSLNKTFNKIESQRTALITKLKTQDAKALKINPSEHTWSVIEVIEHLTAVEETIHDYLEKKLQDKASGQKTGIKEAFRSMMLNSYLSSPAKFKAPVLTMPTGKYASLEEAIAAWQQARGKLQTVWKELPEELLDRNWFKHPSAGRLNLMQMLTFMEAHVSRHEKQIWRTLKEVSTTA